MESELSLIGCCSDGVLEVLVWCCELVLVLVLVLFWLWVGLRGSRCRCPPVRCDEELCLEFWEGALIMWPATWLWIDLELDLWPLEEENGSAPGETFRVKLCVTLLMSTSVEQVTASGLSKTETTFNTQPSFSIFASICPCPSFWPRSKPKLSLIPKRLSAGISSNITLTLYKSITILWNTNTRVMTSESLSLYLIHTHSKKRKKKAYSADIT